MPDTVAPAAAAPARHSLRHLLDAGSFTRPFTEALLDRAERRAMVSEGPQPAPLQGKILATLFYEPSTRTRLSFEAAMLRLGGQVISAENAGGASSAAKGESLEDTVRVVAGYADAIVLRHPETGSASRAAQVSPVPIINAGDGAGQHPTQALLDLFTIRRELGRLDGLRVGLAGDLEHGRTAHSLALALAGFSRNQLILVAPPTLGMGDDLVRDLRARGVAVEEATDLAAIAPSLDVLYQTRLQKERFASDAQAASIPLVDKALMERLPAHAILMHPLPRLNEIDSSVDGDPRAAYFRQARYGLFVRMAILEWIFRGG